MKSPRPPELRLVTLAEGAKPPRPPFGLRVWSPSAEAIALLLDATRYEVATLAGVAEQVPLASTLPPGTVVLVFGAAATRRSLWRMFARRVQSPRDARCSALLVRGYVEIGAGADDVSGTDLAWGTAP